jgi:hypothetical protein
MAFVDANCGSTFFNFNMLISNANITILLNCIGVLKDMCFQHLRIMTSNLGTKGLKT